MVFFPSIKLPSKYFMEGSLLLDLIGDICPTTTPWTLADLDGVMSEMSNLFSSFLFAIMKIILSGVVASDVLIVIYSRR